MSILNVNREELFALVETCDAVEIEECTPPNLREFICRRLEETAPALAKTLVPKISVFDEEQMDELCGYIQETHRLIVRQARRPFRRTNGDADVAGRAPD
jgi:hypothetical protein